VVLDGDPRSPSRVLLKEGRLSEGRACWCSAPSAS